MRVILKEDIKGVGKKDQILEVSDGYARNFLLPKNKAKEANAKNLSELSGKNNSIEYKKEQERQKARKQKEEIEKITVNIKVKIGENGKIFGGVSSKEIADVLKEEHNIEIDKKKINLKNPIKVVGISKVSIKLFEDIVANAKINLLEG